MGPVLPGATIESLTPAPTLSGAESIEISMPVTLANGQVTHRTFKTTLNDLLRIYSLRQDNPNGVTAEQVGAYTIEQVEDLLSKKMGLNDIAVNSLRLDGMTKQEIIDEARNGTSADSMRLGGESIEYFATDADYNELVDILTQSFIAASEEF